MKSIETANLLPGPSRPAAASSYVLQIELPEARKLPVGRLGLLDLAAGRYYYCGSALRGLEARLLRHARAAKRVHWHIDYLLPWAKLSGAWVIRSVQRQECQAAAALVSLGGRRIPRFGSSDCRCGSHLVVSDAPVTLEQFERALAALAPGGPLVETAPPDWLRPS